MCQSFQGWYQKVNYSLVSPGQLGLVFNLVALCKILNKLTKPVFQEIVRIIGRSRPPPIIHSLKQAPVHPFFFFEQVFFMDRQMLVMTKVDRHFPSKLYKMLLLPRIGWAHFNSWLIPCHQYRCACSCVYPIL
jgi:hypothetical protein